MRIRQALGGFIAAAALGVLSSGVAGAASISVASAADTLGGVGTAGTYTGGAGGTLYVPSAPGTAGIPVIITYDAAHTYSAIFTFSPTSAVDGATAIPGGKYATDFTGGTFNFESTDGTTDYLSGTYSAGLMTTAPGATAVQFASGGANDVTYTGGTFLPLAGINPGDIGAFGLSFSGADSGSGTGVGVSGGYINQWTANGFSGTWSAFVPAAAVPEPGSFSVIAFAALMLGGLVLAARRRNHGAAAA
jgi:hypothetical protein